MIGWLIVSFIIGIVAGIIMTACDIQRKVEKMKELIIKSGIMRHKNKIYRVKEMVLKAESEVEHGN